MVPAYLINPKRVNFIGLEDDISISCAYKYTPVFQTSITEHLTKESWTWSWIKHNVFWIHNYIHIYRFSNCFLLGREKKRVYFLRISSYSKRFQQLPFSMKVKQSCKIFCNHTYIGEKIGTLFLIRQVPNFYVFVHSPHDFLAVT